MSENDISNIFWTWIIELNDKYLITFNGVFIQSVLNALLPPNISRIEQPILNIQSEKWLSAWDFKFSYCIWNLVRLE